MACRSDRNGREDCPESTYINTYLFHVNAVNRVFLICSDLAAVPKKGLLCH